jgi:hypothetical protein
MYGTWGDGEKMEARRNLSVGSVSVLAATIAALISSTYYVIKLRQECGTEPLISCAINQVLGVADKARPTTVDGRPNKPATVASDEHLQVPVIVPAEPFPGASRLMGLWSGTLYQNNGTAYMANVTFNVETGSVDYPSLACGGILRRLSVDGDKIFFREYLSYGHGKCIDGGNVTLRLLANGLFFQWDGRHLTRGDLAEGTLQRR